MSKKRILFLTTSLIPIATTVGSLASCSCNNVNKNEYIEEPSASQRQFEVKRHHNLHQDGEYLFTLGGFKTKNISSRRKLNITAKLVIGDNIIPLSLKEAKIQGDGQLIFTLYSQEWDELIAISPSDTPYEIKDLSIKYNGKELIKDGSGYSALIKTGFCLHCYDDSTLEGSVFYEGGDDQTFYIPAVNTEEKSLELCNVDNNFNLENVSVKVEAVNQNFPGSFLPGQVTKIDSSSNLYYIKDIWQKPANPPVDYIDSALKFIIYDKLDSSIIYYENDGKSADIPHFILHCFVPSTES